MELQQSYDPRHLLLVLIAIACRAVGYTFGLISLHVIDIFHLIMKILESGANLTSIVTGIAALLKAANPSFRFREWLKKFANKKTK